MGNIINVLLFLIVQTIIIAILILRSSILFRNNAVHEVSSLREVPRPNEERLTNETAQTERPQTEHGPKNEQAPSSVGLVEEASRSVPQCSYGGTSSVRPAEILAKVSPKTNHPTLTKANVKKASTIKQEVIKADLNQLTVLITTQIVHMILFSMQKQECL